MDNILVFGAGALQVPLIECVKRRGFNPIVVSLNPEEPGMRIVQDKIVDDFCDEQKMLEYAIRYNVKGVVTDQTDLPVRSIAYVCDKIGLPSIGYETACLFTDKFRMREKCRELGIKTLRYQLVSTMEAATSFFASINSPVILKPINNQGSKGVYRVSNLQELKEKFSLAQKYSRNEPILIEEFVEGQELVVEGISVDGFVDNLICGDTFYFNIPDVFSARQRIFPSQKNAEIVKKTLDLNKKIINGFSLNRGITHAEYIIKDGDIYLIEIAARGGGVYISSDIIPLMTGFDTTSFIIDIATKQYVERPIICKKSKIVCYVAFFLPEGTITSISGVDEVVALPYVYHNNLEHLVVGKKIKENTDKTSRFFMVLAAESTEDMDSYIGWIKKKLKVVVTNDAEEQNAIIWM